MTHELTQRNGRDDFDFFMGRWNVHHKRLRERLKSSTEWEEFEGTTVAYKLQGGMGNFDESTLDRESGMIYGMTLRLYDPKSQQWSLYWAASSSSNLYVPMVGGFNDEGIGEFYAQEPFEGRAIFSRFIWSKITPTSCQWEQAFSADGGKTWETNWIMENTRQE